jgi:phage gpG-like protein
MANSPVKTGRLAGSITWATQSGNSSPTYPAHQSDRVSTPSNDHTLHVGTNVEYAEVVEYGGLRTYIIEPKEKKALYWKGAAHPVKRVVHPPNPAFPFLRPALDDNIEEIKEVFAEALRGGIRRHGK